MRCEDIIRILKIVPVIIITLIIAWSYYVYVFDFCIATLHSSTEALILLVFYHISLFFLLWSYYQTVFSKVALVPLPFKLSQADMDHIKSLSNKDAQAEFLFLFARDLPIYNCKINLRVRFCEKCEHLKPDRAHHCSVCKTCVLKFDHHCAWVNNCINFSNYKYFVLFLGYGLTYCIYVFLTMLKFFILFWREELNNIINGQFHHLILFVGSIIIAFILVLLFGRHMHLVLKNRTSIETISPPVFNVPGLNGFSFGYLNNFEQVFGDQKKYWLLPIYTSLGDGVKYVEPFYDDD